MTTDVGRVPDGTELSSPIEPASGFTPSGFDPSRDELPTDLDRARCEGKPRHLPRAEKDVLESFVSDIEARLKAMPDAELHSVVTGCLNVSPINCWWWTYAFADIIYPFAAEEVERRRDSDGSAEGGETGTGSTEGNSAGPQDIAQNQSEPSS